MLVLDTCVLIDGVGEVDEPLAISVLSLVEMESGLGAAPDAVERARRQRQYDDVVARYDPIPVDQDVLARYGQIDAAVRAIGRQPRSRTVDLLIAATAASVGAGVLTDNLDDFTGLGGLVEVRVASPRLSGPARLATVEG